jgi:hypothetical protein
MKMGELDTPEPEFDPGFLTHGRFGTAIAFDASSLTR